MLTINNFLDEQLFQEIKLSYPSLSFFESHGNKWQGNNRYNISYIKLIQWFKIYFHQDHGVISSKKLTV